MQVWFCRWAVIFATVHCSQGFTGSLYLQDPRARIKITFFQQSHTSSAIHFSSSDQLWQDYIQMLSKQRANTPSSPCSCTFREVQIKSQTFMLAQATDFLRLLVSPVASCTRAFPTPALPLAWFTCKQHTNLSRIIYTYREHGTPSLTSKHVEMIAAVLMSLAGFPRHLSPSFP